MYRSRQNRVTPCLHKIARPQPKSALSPPGQDLGAAHLGAAADSRAPGEKCAGEVWEGEAQGQGGIGTVPPKKVQGPADVGSPHLSFSGSNGGIPGKAIQLKGGWP